jgi:ClpP class serine protease
MSTNNNSSLGFGRICLIGGGLLISTYILGNALSRKLTKSKKKKDNIVSIINVSRSLNDKTQMNFLTQSKNLTPDKDVNIIIHTFGGYLFCGEAISQYIFNLRNSGKYKKIRCYVPYYACSAGCMISLCCDEIVATKNSLFGPCDAQCAVGIRERHSADTIIRTVTYKQENKEKIDESWLASGFDCKQVLERQKEFVNKIQKECKYTDDQKETIYTEMFSGKYNHDKFFTGEELQKICGRVTIVDTMPEFVTYVTGKECEIDEDAME